jgi:Flp pilus assembly protein TadG
MTMVKRLRSLYRDTRGVSAVEFSIIAPVLMAMVIAVMEGGLLTLRSYDMRAAINSGAQYIMQGGTDSAAAKAIVMAAWTRKSPDATATVTQSCRCGTTVQACTVLCADGSVPMSYYVINATMVSKGMFTNNVLTYKDTVRVR